ncbi:MAG TPA: DUF3046 domain-containing protein [Actinomycetaceae bacterium]|nr:DUF3046 domain-containing protein [Actinomycetaceae bacterium]
MKHSELDQAFIDAFGRYRGPALHRDLALTRFGSRSAWEAVREGEDPQAVWSAVCEEMELDDEWRFPHRRERRSPQPTSAPGGPGGSI